jgi:hypothetical protein
VTERHESLIVARDATTEGKISTVKYVQHEHPRYTKLVAELQKFPDYTPILVDFNFYPVSAVSPDGSMAASDKERRLRYDFRCGLALPLSASCYAYTPGGSHQQLFWVWTCPRVDLIDDGDRTAEARLIAALLGDMPIYHTRAMNAEAEAKFGNVPSMTPQLVRTMRRAFSFDASAPRTVAEGELENHLFDYMSLGGDSGIYMDLRALNQRPAAYDDFWEYANLWINDALRPAADDRRHMQRQGAILNASKAISIPDMLSQVKAAWFEEHNTELAVLT